MEEKIYVTEIIMSSPNKQESTKRINEMESLIRYKFTEEKRREISRIRAYTNGIKYSYCVKFYSLYIAKESTIPRINEIVQKADRELYIVHPELRAQVKFFPLSREDIRNSEIYTEILHAIRTQVYGSLVERLRDIVKRDTVPKKSIKSLETMIDQFSAVNILNDEEVTRQILTMKEMVRNRLFSPLLTEMEKIVKEMGNSFSYVEEEEEGELKRSSSSALMVEPEEEPEEPEEEEEPEIIIAI
jgi:hypothetical protein